MVVYFGPTIPPLLVCDSFGLTGLGVELGDRATRPSPQTVQTARHWSLAHRDASVASDRVSDSSSRDVDRLDAALRRGERRAWTCNWTDRNPFRSPAREHRSRYPHRLDHARSL